MEDQQSWTKHFLIQPEADLDFVLGQDRGLPVGMSRRSPQEFRQRITAAAISYYLQLQSIDYTLKKYVKSQTDDQENKSVGDSVSGYLRKSFQDLEKELKALHTPEDIPFGVFGAEISLYKLPYTLDIARILSNKGLLLEVLPILRLSLEMITWSYVAFRFPDEKYVISLKASNCVPKLKSIYPSAGKIYGYLSNFTHWGHIVHGHFINVSDDSVSILKASPRYRAMALMLCTIILEILIEVIRILYPERSAPLITCVQGVPDQNNLRKTRESINNIYEIVNNDDILEIRSLIE